MLLLLTDNQILNTAHMIDAVFEPAKPEQVVFDEEQDQNITHRATVAKLTITTTEQQAERVTTYDGEVQGVVSTNECIRLSGENAERVWTRLCKMCR